MKKIGLFAFLMFIVPTVSLNASSISIDDCINYMNDVFNSQAGTSTSIQDNSIHSNNQNEIDTDMPCH